MKVFSFKVVFEMLIIQILTLLLVKEEAICFTDKSKVVDKQNRIIDEENSPFDESKVYLFLPIYDFQSPDKIKKKNSKEVIINSAIRSNYTKSDKEIKENAYILNHNSTEYLKIDETYEKEVINKLIFRETNKPEVSLNPNNKQIYAFPNITYFKNQNSNNKIFKNIELNDYSKIAHKIKFSKNDPIIFEKPICIPGVQIFSIQSIKESLTISNVYTDIYQVSVFIYTKKASKTNPDNSFPQIISPNKGIVLQIVTLSDLVGTTNGNLYVNLQDGSIIVIPIILISSPNSYGVFPLYETRLAESKILNVPIELTNPHNETLIVKEVVHSFNSISLIWPNGQVLSTSINSTTNISPEMMEFKPNTKKTIINIYFYKEVSNLEYGLIHFKTDKDTIIIPVLIKVEIKGIEVLPNYFNFGLVDIGNSIIEEISKIKRLIPIYINNVSNQKIKLKALYIDVEESLVEFVISKKLTYCNVQHEYKEEKMPVYYKNSKHITNYGVKAYTTFDFCVIPKEEKNLLLGYLVLDPSNYHGDSSSSHRITSNTDKIIKGNIILHTDFTTNSFITLPYEYTITLSVFKPNNKGFHFNSLNITDDQSIPLSFSSKLPNLSFIDDYSKFMKLTLDLTTTNQEKEKLSSTTYNYSIQIIDKNFLKTTKQIFLKTITNSNQIAILPLNFYDMSLYFVSCNGISDTLECINSNNFKVMEGINFKNDKFEIDLGLIADHEVQTQYFFLINPNCDRVVISDFYSISDTLKIDLFNVESTDERKYHLYKNISNQKLIQDTIKKEIDSKKQIELYYETLTVFSLDLTRTSELFYSKVVFEIEDKFKFEIGVKAKFINGTLSIMPNQMRFDSAFPGLFQSKLISAKSSFIENVSIKSVECDDERIQVSVLNNVISNTSRTEIIKVNFDPSKVHWEENFMRGNFTMNINNNKYLTYKELYWWRQKQKAWEVLGSLGKSEIKANIKIKTDVKNDYIQVTGSLNKPPLVKKDELDFKLTQIGEQITRYIEVFNESDEYMSIQILLAPAEFNDINSNKVFANTNIQLNTNKNMAILDCFLQKPDGSLAPLGNQHFHNNKNKKDQQISMNKNNNNNSNNNNNNKKKSDSHKIFLDENINQENMKFFSKEEIVLKIFKYASVNTKSSILNSEKLICNSEYINKNEVIFRNDVELIQKIFSNDFDNEIPSVAKMTSYTLKKKMEANKIDLDSMGLLDYISYYFKLIFITDDLNEASGKQVNSSKNNTVIEKYNQDFFLHHSISENTYIIKPHSKLKIGPIFYHPSDFTNSKATLFIKNNLTILYPISLKGSGGSGILEFYNLEPKHTTLENEIKDIEDGIRVEDYTEEKINDVLVINIDKNYFEKHLSHKYKNNNEYNKNYNLNNEVYNIINNKGFEIKKTIKLKNTGNLPVKINKITVENVECESYGIKINDCNLITLKSKETKSLSITIKPDFNFYYMEKEIVFSTPYKNVSLKICINIRNDMLSMKNSIINISNLFGENLTLVILVFAIIVIIIQVTFNEHYELTHSSRTQIEFFNYKEIVKANPDLQFEYLFIKAYRKQDSEEFSEKFFTEQMDKPGAYDGTSEMPFKDKRRTKAKKDNIFSSSNNIKSGGSNNNITMVNDNSKIKDDALNNNTNNTNNVNNTINNSDFEINNNEKTDNKKETTIHSQNSHKKAHHQVRDSNKEHHSKEQHIVHPYNKDKELTSNSAQNKIKEKIGNAKTKKNEINVDGKKTTPINNINSSNILVDNKAKKITENNITSNINNANNTNNNSNYKTNNKKQSRNVNKDNVINKSDFNNAFLNKGSFKEKDNNNNNNNVVKEVSYSSNNKESIYNNANNTNNNYQRDSKKYNNSIYENTNNNTKYTNQESLSETELMKVISKSKPYIPKSVNIDSNLNNIKSYSSVYLTNNNSIGSNPSNNKYLNTSEYINEYNNEINQIDSNYNKTQIDRTQKEKTNKVIDEEKDTYTGISSNFNNRLFMDPHDHDNDKENLENDIINKIEFTTKDQIGNLDLEIIEEEINNKQDNDLRKPSSRSTDKNIKDKNEDKDISKTNITEDKSESLDRNNNIKSNDNIDFDNDNDNDKEEDKEVDKINNISISEDNKNEEIMSKSHKSLLNKVDNKITNQEEKKEATLKYEELEAIESPKKQENNLKCNDNNLETKDIETKEDKTINSFKYKFSAFNKPNFGISKKPTQQDTQETPQNNISNINYSTNNTKHTNTNIINNKKILEKQETIKTEESSQDEDIQNSSHYLSEYQFPPESGPEDFSRQFNFNNIFGGNSNNMKINSYNVETDNEDKGHDDNYLYNYSGFNNFAFLNPFSNDTEEKSTNLLGDLRDDDEDEEDEEENKNYNDEEKVDENNDDEEDDPEWIEEDMKIKQEGFFDDCGEFKLKQTDFGFGMDKIFSKK